MRSRDNELDQLRGMRSTSLAVALKSRFPALIERATRIEHLLVLLCRLSGLLISHQVVLVGQEEITGSANVAGAGIMLISIDISTSRPASVHRDVAEIGGWKISTLTVPFPSPKPGEQST